MRVRITKRTVTSGCSLLLLVLGSVFGSACRIRQPSLAEQETLMQRGYFSAGVPSWVATGLTNGPVQTAESYGAEYETAGLMPPRLQGMPQVTQTSFTSAQPYEMVVKPRELKEQAASRKQPAVSEVSPIDRVERACPGNEEAVRDALVTEDIATRIAKWETLTGRCENSSDLWYWLGVDYYRDQKPAAAGRVLNRALELDNSNTEAKALLDKIRDSNQN